MGSAIGIVTNMGYELQYMDLRARGEPVRWLLKVLEQPYTEQRIDVFTQWPLRKNDFHFKVTPVLVVDGEQLHQTTVICRYLGKKHQLASLDLWTATRQEEIMEAFHDISYYVGSALVARVLGNEALAKSNAEKVKERLPVVLQNIEVRVSEEGWILSPEKTWVDVAVAAYLDIYRDILGTTLLEDYPRTKALLEAVTSLPPIAAWLDERPPLHKFEDPEGLF
ncbi:hypothetical protein Pmani_011351 [Petrolisthes manimaculis]|uniref:glutathione transferase n=1 Tax=Petrolisthes manimaculis TaxID=1843537 RepID=A0AAE1UG95_9EUCA|nr:hypothetical protein Pmani_011351 [Petrolisthes manimaculis]